jgi:hypothetical protein
LPSWRAGSAAERAAAESRDLRLDLLRGFANGPSSDNVVNWITTRNYGFSDAAEIFVFISCYTAVLVYERVMRRHGFQPACARKFQRGIGRPDEQALRQCLSPMRGVSSRRSRRLLMTVKARIRRPG